MIFKSQIHKQVYNILKKDEIEDLVKYINNSNVSVDNKLMSDTINGNLDKKKKKGKKLKNNKTRKNSEEAILDKFLKNLKNNSVPVDKIVKIKTDLTNNWVNEIIKES